VFLGGQPRLHFKGRAPAPNFRDPYLQKKFDLGRPKFGVITHVGRSVFLWASHAPYPKGTNAPVSPEFLVPPICEHAL